MADESFSHEALRDWRTCNPLHPAHADAASKVNITRRRQPLAFRSQPHSPEGTRPRRTAEPPEWYVKAFGLKIVNDEKGLFG